MRFAYNPHDFKAFWSMRNPFLVAFFLFFSCFPSNSEAISYSDLLKIGQKVDPRVELIYVKQPEYRNTYINGKHVRFPGMFSVFNTVLGCLDLYEEKNYAAITVDFSDEGLYYEQAKGLNWWNYYCEPINVQKRPPRKTTIFEFDSSCERSFHAELHLSRERNFELISKYIKFKPYILEKIEKFCEENFEAKTLIGLHYRGTDKSSEAPKVPFEEVAHSIETYLYDHQISDYQIFVATDEQSFLDYIQANFPERVVFLPAERAKDDLPLHYNTKNPFQQGLETVLDCILLSKADVLFRTSSNLSLWSTFLNPKMKVVLFNDRFSSKEQK